MIIMGENNDTPQFDVTNNKQSLITVHGGNSYIRIPANKSFSNMNSTTRIMAYQSALHYDRSKLKTAGNKRQNHLLNQNSGYNTNQKRM